MTFWTKGIAVKTLPLAAVNGALTTADSKTVLTFRGNPAGIVVLLKGDDIFRTVPLVTPPDN